MNTAGCANAEGQHANPYISGVAYPNVPLGDYSVPSGWPGPVARRQPGQVFGPPVSFLREAPQEAKAGVGFKPDYQREGNLFYFHTDHLGSTSYLTDTAGNVSQFVWYAPYGESLVDEHTTTYENPFKFSGKELDDITGLYDHGSRSRNPISTLWYEVDPRYEEFPEMSPFAYCHGNPVRLIDMDGECPALIFPLAEIATDAIIATGLIVYGAVVCERIFDKAKESYDNYKENNIDSSYKSDEIKSRDKSNSSNKTRSSTKNSEDTGKFDGKNSTENKTRRAAYRNAKDQNGIPRSQQPDKTIKPNTPEGNKLKPKSLDPSKNVRQDEFTNSRGEKISIREVRPVKYNQGGNGVQGPHFNAWKSGSNHLKQHHYYDR